MPMIRDTFGVHVTKEWLDLVGKSADEAKAVVEAGNPKLKVEIVQDDSQLPDTVNEERVRIYVNAEGKVTRVPTIG